MIAPPKYSRRRPPGEDPAEQIVGQRRIASIELPSERRPHLDHRQQPPRLLDHSPIPVDAHQSIRSGRLDAEAVQQVGRLGERRRPETQQRIRAS